MKLSEYGLETLCNTNNTDKDNEYTTEWILAKNIVVPARIGLKRVM